MTPSAAPGAGRTIVVAGASGLIGTPLTRHLRKRGYDVRQLVRRSTGGPGEVSWDPATGKLDPSALDGVHAIVNLGGAGVGERRWTKEYRALILSSRVDGTSLLARTAAKVERPPARIIQGSASGYYGDRGDEVLDEASSGGDDFLADVVRQWEAAMDPAREAGIPVVHARSGIVLAPSRATLSVIPALARLVLGGRLGLEGGALAVLLPILRLGVGGRLGTGAQWWPWITLPDEVRALLHLVESGLTGPVNLTAPEPARNVDVARALASALHRPAIVPIPAAALRLLLGGFADDILGSQRLLPRALVTDGFQHRHRTIDDAAAWLVG
jgi:NAD dependent epimerase/dehydratase family enzyme